MAETVTTRGPERISNRDTVTGRAASSTVSPDRTRSYARLPWTLIADTELGTCINGPVSPAIPARMSTSVTPSTERVATTTPSASSVSVCWPSRIVAR